MTTPSTDSPVFIIGTERSGTNLLRLMLDAHPDLTVPHPPHILKNFFDLVPLYGDLKDDLRFRTLIRDVIRSVELHPYPWDIRLDEDAVFAAAEQRNLLCVFFAIYDQYLAHTGKKRWVCKSTFMIRHVAWILQFRPAAKFIYLVRDGRDVAASARETIFNHFHPWYCADLWRREQITGISWLGTLDRERIFLLKYEDLVADPEAQLKKLSAFLGMAFAPAMLEYFKTGEARKSGALSAAWKNTAKPVSKDGVRRFEKSLSPEDISLIEAISGAQLRFFSYLPKPDPAAPPTPAPSAPDFRVRYFIAEVLQSIRIQIKYLFLDNNSFLRYKKFWFFMYLRAVRTWI